MIIIRLLRVGKRNQPFFKIVVTDKRRAVRSGKFIEQVGSYNPLKKEKILNAERIKYWISVGAKASPTIHNMFISEKIIEGKKIPVHKKSKKKVEAAPEVAAVVAAPVAPAVEKAPEVPKIEEAPKAEEPVKIEAPAPEPTPEAPKPETPVAETSSPESSEGPKA